MTNEEAINYFKRSYASGDTDDERQHNEALDLATKAIEDIEKIKAIIKTPENFLEQDVYRYKMICEVIKNERKTEGKETEERA